MVTLVTHHRGSTQPHLATPVVAVLRRLH